MASQRNVVLGAKIHDQPLWSKWKQRHLSQETNVSMLMGRTRVG